MKTWKDVAGFEGRYQITESGEIRTTSKKLKKTIIDRRGKGVVVIDDVAHYIDELVSKTFGTSDPDVFNEFALEAANQSISSNRSSRSKYMIRREDTGEEYSSISSAAKVNKFNYDKFYNMFYLHPDKDVIEFEGITFRKVIR